MALAFVSTSILKSSEASEGLGYDEEIDIKKDKSNSTTNSSAKPLYQQLAEQQEARDLLYEEQTKLLNAPPKGLDADEANFLDECLAQQKTIENARKHQEEEALQAFRQCQQKSRQLPAVGDISTSNIGSLDKGKGNITLVKPTISKKTSIANNVIIKKKRKINDVAETASVGTLTEPKKQHKEEEASHACNVNSNRGSNSKDNEPTSAPNALSALMGAYSDSDSDN